MTRPFGGRRQIGAAVLLAMTLPAASALPSVAATRTSLVRQVTITGDRTGWVAVTLPASILADCPAVPSCVPKAALRLSGGAYGYSLVYENDTASKPVPASVVLRLPKAQGGSIMGLVSGTDPRTGINTSDTRRLPAGRYRLFLLTNGRGSVSVRFPELRIGSLATRPTRSTAVKAVEAKPDLGGPLAPSAWASGVTVDPDGVRSRGYSFAWTDGAVAVGSVMAGCVYNGAPPNGRWVPGCPGGSSLMANQLTPATNCCGTAYGIAIGGSGRFSFGQYYVQGGPVTSAGMFFVWLPER